MWRKLNKKTCAKVFHLLKSTGRRWKVRRHWGPDSSAIIKKSNFPSSKFLIRLWRGALVPELVCCSELPTSAGNSKCGGRITTSTFACNDFGITTSLCSSSLLSGGWSSSWCGERQARRAYGAGSEPALHDAFKCFVLYRETDIMLKIKRSLIVAFSPVFPETFTTN